MRRHLFAACVIFLIVAGVVARMSLAAPTTPSASQKKELTAAQKRDLKEIGNEASKVFPLIAKKKYSEAGTAIKDVEDRLGKFISDAGLKESDTVLKFVQTQIVKGKSQLAKALEKGGPSFEKSVATTLARKCVECHAEDEPKGGLRLDTFEGIEKGGKTGALIAEGDPESSLLMQRLTTQDPEHRMPLGKEPLLDKEIQAIATWISEGSQFEGDKTATMESLAKAAMAKPAVSNFGKKNSRIEVTKETGNETVHFTKDIMPELVDTCGRCHNDKDKRSGFSVMSFEKLMKGGDSGAVIAPGNLESSRLWRLVNGDDTPVMPLGNDTGITRKWHGNLKTWISEGAKFDGSDPKKNFPSLQEREVAALSKFTPEQWLDRRKKSSDEAWKKTYPQNEPTRVESAEFLIYGDAPAERLQQVDKWATEQANYLRQTFKIKDEPLWRGKLAVFVFKDRFGYEEFNTSVHRREVSKEVFGHSQVDSSMDDALIALQDPGDSASETSPSLHVNVVDQVTSAFFKRGGALPEWLGRGVGLAFATQKYGTNPYLAAMPRHASKILQDSKMEQPTAIFDDGTFSPSDIGPIGCTLAGYLLKRGTHQFGQFVQALQSGSKVDAALTTVYRSNAAAVAAGYAGSLPSGGKKGKK